MNRESVKAEIQKVLSDLLRVKPEMVTESARLVEDLDADSLLQVQMSIELEKAFKITIPDTDLPNLLTVGDLNKYVCGKLGID